MQFPSFIRDPAVAVVGEKCYVSLVENLNIKDIDCIKYAISKGLGLGIVLGGSIVKVPQILTILRNKSAQGLSLTSYLLETLSYFITLSYNLRQGNPFSTFGEIMFICIQNIMITSLIFYFGRQQGQLLAVLVGLAGLFYTLNDNTLVSPVLMSSLYAATIPLSLASKVPQIYTNFKNKSTGQLSVFTVVNYFAGSAARVFTTMTELDDTLMLFGNLLATTFNAILVLQVVLYWGNKVQHKPISKLD
ncbi:uncharacterized protein B0P05DRAFT_474329 [Gilbertella persicaria]|uniref:Mannose-P-dolichol utilization defect 1 protein homolog n=1 Tax=Rhizopus stolonifer TaxID=4846 RepID=A0A367IY51_RHIST|nr:uncharacterized protein B0P05DRAFT_474329 [Gilbertella persicaria]KAI8070626.1 hypothetical protein B0P05DRAFT_474329 [Gilbertella persicaria]RCH82576.1 hypothetical protein CU098_003326 [Rhizopus stolonifer]